MFLNYIYQPRNVCDKTYERRIPLYFDNIVTLDVIFKDIASETSLHPP